MKGRPLDAELNSFIQSLNSLAWSIRMTMEPADIPL